MPGLERALQDFDERVGRQMRDIARRNPELAPKGPFSVHLHASPREEGNDDNLVGGDDFLTYEAALLELRRLTASPRHAEWAHAYLDAADGTVLRQVNPSPRRTLDDGMDLDRAEAAGQAGMAFGTAGRNEALGEDVEDAPAFGMR